MTNEFEDVEIPDEILDFIAGGTLSEGDMDELKRYVEFFKEHKYPLWYTQNKWVEHMRLSHVTSHTEEEARDFIAKVW